MPRNKVSYKPVRYVSRKKAYTSSYSRKQYRGKEANLQVNQNYSENKGQTSEMPEYPINNIVALPQNSDALNNVIRQNQQDFSYKKYLRRKAKGRSNTYCRNTTDTNCDVKPDINEIKFKTLNNFNVNRHTFILSDSEDDISFEETMNNKNINKNSHSLLRENVDNKAEKNDERSSSADDDVILVENEAENDIIEIDDNMEQDIPEVNDNTGECNALVSTPESSTSNDFLENSQLNQNPKFNFSLHGSEFKDSEFLIPTINVDISESGSISSISDISNSLKTNVFNLVDFPKEKDNLFDENNLEKFKNSITPQRHIENSVIADHSNFMGKADIYSKKQLPTLSDIGTDHKTHKRVRGRSVIRELVNDRAYILLSSAEKKMKAKKRKVKDGISNSLNDTDLTEITSPETSKKKKRKKMKKKEVSLTGETDDCENCENMIRTDSFSGVHANTHDKSENTNGGVILEKSEITFKQKQKKHQLVQVVDTNDVRKRSKKDRLFSGNSEKEECEQIILKKSDKAGKKNIQHKNEEQIELKDQVNTSLIERKRKRRKEQRLSEGEVVDGADGEISIEVSSISKRKPKKKRLSENYETENCQPTEVESTDCEVNIETSEKYIRQKTYSNTDNASEVLHIQENSPPLTNLDESSFITCTEHGQKVDETELYIIECKPMEKEANNITQISSLKHTSDVVESSPLLDLVESNIDIGDHKPINKLDFVKNYSEPITYNETPSLADKNSTDSKESIRNMLRDIESPKQMLDAVQSTTSVSSEDNFKSSIDKNNCINQNLDKSCATAETAYAVCKLSETLTAGDKLLNKKLEENEVLHSTEDNGVNLSQIATSFTCKEENTEIVSLPTQVKMENLCDTTLHVNNQTNVVHVDEKNRNSELLQIEKDVINLVVKNEPQELESISCKEKQELKVGSTESNLPIVSVKQECDFSISEVKEKLPDVIEKIISKKDPITSMRTLCEYLEEVNDPLDVLKKVSMIKEAFLAKSVDTEVDSPSIIEEVVSEDDVHSVSSDGSSVLCIESDSSDIDLIDNFTLINCESSTPVKEVGKSNKGFEKHTFVSNKSCSDTDKNITKDKDICNDKRRHETRSLLHSREAGNHERGLDKYDVEGIQQFMSDDQKLWEISAEDLPHKQFVPKGKRCVKCKEIGHLGYNCPNKSNLPKCILCGVAGHLDFKCPNRICTQCGRKSSIMKSTCQYCKHYRSSTCSLCKMRGHPRNKCPDLWRRYHLTVEHGPLVKPEGNLRLKNKENLWCCFCAKSGHLYHYCFSAKRNQNFHPIDPSIRYYIDVYRADERINNDVRLYDKDEIKTNNEVPQNTSKNTTLHKSAVLGREEITAKNTVYGRDCEATKSIPKNTAKDKPQNISKNTTSHRSVVSGSEETTHRYTVLDRDCEASKSISKNTAKNTPQNISNNTTPHKSVVSGSEETTAKNTVYDRNCEASKSISTNTAQNTPENISKNGTPHKSVVLGSEEITAKNILQDRDCEASKSKPKNTTKNTPQNMSEDTTPHKSVDSGNEETRAKNTFRDRDSETSKSIPTNTTKNTPQNMSKDTTPHKSVVSGNEEITAKNTVHDRVCEASKSTPKNTTRNTPQIVAKNMTPHKSAVAGSEEITVKDTVRDRVCEAIKSTPKNTTRNTPQIVSKNMTPHESTVSGTEEITAKNTVHDHNCETSNTHVECRSSSRQLLSVDVNAASRASLEQSHIPIKESTQDESTRNSYTPPVDDLIDGLPSDFYVIDEIVDKSEVEVSVTPPNDVMQIDNDRKTATTENNASSITNSLSDKNDYKELNSKSCSSDVNLNKDLDHKSKSSESQIEPETGAVDSNFDVINFFLTSDVNSLKTYLKAELSVLRKSSFKVKNYYYRLLAYKEDSNKPEHEWKISLVKKQKLYKEINMMLFGREQIKAGRFHYGELAKFVNNASGFITKHFRDSLYSSYEYIFSNTLHRHVNYEQMIEILMRKYSNRTI